MSSPLAAAWFIGRKDVRYMLRQRETLLWAFVMPIVFFYFIGTVTGGFGGGDGSGPDPLALRAPTAGGVIVGELVRRLEEEGFRVDRPDSTAVFQRYRRRLTISEPPANHATLDAAVAARQPVTLTFAREGDDPGVQLDRFRVQRAVYTVLADLAVITVNGERLTQDAFTRLAEAPRALTMRVEAAGERVDPPVGFEQAVPGTMVMFTMLVLLTSGAMLLVIERERGLLRRLASTPIAAGSVVLGKWLGKMVLGLVQLAFAVAAGTLLFDIDWGGAIGMLAAVLIAWAGFNASLGILLGNLARSQAQVGGIGVLATMVLAALGGAWWPIEITPDWMQTLALLIPTGWTMDAMHRLISFGQGATAVLPHLLALAVGAALLGWLGARTFRYM